MTIATYAADEAPDGKSLLRTKKISHPGAREGLYLIDEDGVYHYRAEVKSSSDNSMHIRFVSVTTPEITANVGGDELVFNDFYSDTQLTGLDFVYEWQPWKRFGKLGLQLGAGLTFTQGKGQFVDPPSSGVEPLESYTLFTIPVSAGVIYRFEYTDRQWFVPYISGGLTYYGLVEYREDGDVTAVGSPAGYGAGGLMINLTAFNRDLAFTMDREYGFSNLWFSAEYRYNQSFNEDLDVTSDQISVGIGVDY